MVTEYCASIPTGGAPSPAPTSEPTPQPTLLPTVQPTAGLILDAEVVEAIAATTTAAVYGSNTHQKHTQCATSLHPCLAV